MAEALRLEAAAPLEGLLPLEIGKVAAREVSFAAITSVAPFAGRHADVSAALEARLGAGLPEVGRSTASGDVRVVWAGRGQFFVLGAALAGIEGAALTDQGDAWACAALMGPGTRDVLARLVPVDLRDAAFPEGAAARTLLGHMPCVLMRSGAERYEVMVFRSMAHTLRHDLKEAMESVAALGR